MAGEIVVLTHMFEGVECSEKEYTACKLRWGDDHSPQRAEINFYINQLREGTIVKSVEPQVASSVEATLAQRGSRYGDFTDHARLCQDLKEVMVNSRTRDKFDLPISGWEKLDTVKKQALEVIADKIARILTGDPNYDDNWHDIQGYAKLVEDRLPCNVKNARVPNINDMV